MNNFYETKRVNGLLHNDDGPAVVQLDGTQGNPPVKPAS